MFAAKRRAHLDLPLAGLAVGDDQIGFEPVYLIEQPLTDGLAGVVRLGVVVPLLANPGCNCLLLQS